MKKISYGIAAGLVLLCAAAGIAQNPGDPLKSGFENPPSSARPRVWWHWMNGNISKPGIRLDLEWMHSIGLAGFQNFDAALSTPQVVPHRLVYMTSEWKDAFRYAIHLGDQYGMEMAIAGSPGWSESGGPWVTAREGMKKYVWSETDIEGGKPFHDVLTHPPSNTGAFQDEVTHDFLGDGKEKKLPRYYADAAVIAFRRPADEQTVQELGARITDSGGPLDLALLSDGDLQKYTEIAIPEKGRQAWIQYAFPHPVTMHAVTFDSAYMDELQSHLAGTNEPVIRLVASNDGQVWKKVAELNGQEDSENTIAFPAVTASYFRVTFDRTAPSPFPGWAKGMKKMPTKPTTWRLAELVLHPGARVNHWQAKAAFYIEDNLYPDATPAVSSAAAIRKSDVIDLTKRMKPDGTLDWTPPPGNWVVLRFGYSLLGITNHPATAEATGLEVDKLNGRYVRDYFEKYLDSYKNTVGADEMGRKGIRYVINDSWEAGPENWTDDMIADFKRLRGYDPTPWMPVLAGYVVQNSAASDRFLWDFRKTIADLIATEHYGTLEAVLHEHGMGHYGESHESGRAFIADGMQVKKYNEIPMSAMWTQDPGVHKELYGLNADDRESASVAHIYGQNLAAAESMTAYGHPWYWSPNTLKPTADQEFLNGINRIVIHESAHQPLTDPKKVPGLTLGPFGQWFNRNDTWAYEAAPWIKYLARSSYMLQQGRFSADLVYFYGEDSNLTAIFANKAPKIPAGYPFDYINADALIHELSVKDGLLVTPSGMRYKVLGLDPYSEHMSLPVLKAIDRLVEAGATVAGPKPIDDPSEADNQAEFKRLKDLLFGDGTGTHTVGKGKVFAGQSLSEVFRELGFAPDFDYDNHNAHLEFVHRKLANGDIYFVDNRSGDSVKVNARFRVTGKAPELWYAETGRSEPASFTIAGGRTTVPLSLGPWGTVFVVFHKPVLITSRTVPAVIETKLATVEGPWTVAFQPDRGAPASITMDALASWSDNSNSGVKYFSGTGTYTKTIQAPATWFTKGARLYLDLGRVKNLAVVTVNGRNLGVAWHTPYRVDVTGALKPGANHLEIKVIDSWVNRLIGDQQPGATKYTFTDIHTYDADSPLVPAGLLGPVEVIRDQRE